MNEMINAVTNLMPIMAVQEKNGPYINISLIAFSLIGFVNHAFSENFDGYTHLVKLMVTNLQFGIMGFDPIISFTISLFDLSPWYFKNKLLANVGEKLV